MPPLWGRHVSPQQEIAMCEKVEQLTRLYRDEFLKQFGKKDKLYRDWIKNDPAPGKLIVEAIAQRKAHVLIRHLCSGRNPVSVAVFERHTGIKMPRREKWQKVVIERWARGVGPP